MQATMTIDRPGNIARTRLLARLALGLAAALALGFGVGYITAPAGHQSQPVVKVVTVPVGSDQSGGGRYPTHGQLP